MAIPYDKAGSCKRSWNSINMQNIYIKFIFVIGSGQEEM